MAVLWFRPACDTLLAKIQRWHDLYEAGEVYSTRRRIDDLGLGVEDAVTRYLHRIPFSQVEFGRLVEIMKHVEPKSKLTADLNRIWSSMQKRFADLPVASRPKLTRSNEWLVTLAYYKVDVQEILDVLYRVRDGRQTLEELMKEQKGQGKSLFEV